jgi:hypothetical protein
MAQSHSSIHAQERKTKNNMIVPSSQLAKLRTHFNSKGFELWFVGGCVRDTLLGVEPKDIDLCTDATPDEAIEVYDEFKIRYFPTGIKHGTITAVLRGPKTVQKSGRRSSLYPYEITSLRTESDHDGRHAVVAYTRDLLEDLSRRDLTINAMAQDFDGNIIDPFGGMSDLRDERVRLVGNAEERFKEDYLRILRFFRFHARFAGKNPYNEQADIAIRATMDNLSQISGERIWQEMSKIIVGPDSAYTIDRMKQMGVMKYIQAPRIDSLTALQCQIYGLSRSPTVLGLCMKNSELEETMSRWKLSNAERSEARFACRNKSNRDIESYKEQLVDGAYLEYVEELLNFHSLEPLRSWDVPVFPVDGLDLINRKGIKTGPAIGIALRGLRQKWKDSDYTLTKDQLLGGM